MIKKTQTLGSISLSKIMEKDVRHVIREIFNNFKRKYENYLNLRLNVNIDNLGDV